MNRIALTLLGLTLALSPSAAATKLSLYPSFTEVQQPLPAATRTLAFTAQQWTLLQPDSFTVGDGTSTTLSWQPTDPDWLQTQEGQRVTWIRAGQPPLPATLERAEDLLLKLDTGGYVNASRNDLAFGQKPPPQSGMVLRLGGMDRTTPSVLTYRTQALSWIPRYKLNLEETGAKLVALAQITNASDQVFTAEQVDLYGGTVQQGSSPVPTAGKTGQTSAAVPTTVPAVKVDWADGQGPQQYGPASLASR